MLVRPCSSHRQSCRPALAPLELVLALPFLLLAAVLIYKVAEGNLLKSECLIQARREAWGFNGGPIQPEGSLVQDNGSIASDLGISAGADHGLANRQITRRLSFPLGGGSIPIEARQIVLKGSWDYRSIDINPGSFQPDAHATSLIDALAGGNSPQLDFMSKWNRGDMTGGLDAGSLLGQLASNQQDLGQKILNGSNILSSFTQDPKGSLTGIFNGVKEGKANEAIDNLKNALTAPKQIAELLGKLNDGLQNNAPK